MASAVAKITVDAQQLLQVGSAHCLLDKLLGEAANQLHALSGADFVSITKILSQLNGALSCASDLPNAVANCNEPVATLTGKRTAILDSPKSQYKADMAS